MIKVGQSASFTKTITESDVVNFAGLSGDFNSVHINDVAARDSFFGKRVAHGMLVSSLISCVLGTKLPGEGTIYLEQQLLFKKPVFINDTCSAVVVVEDILDEKKGIYRMKTTVLNQNSEIVIDGYAVVMYKESDYDTRN